MPSTDAILAQIKDENSRVLKEAEANGIDSALPVPDPPESAKKPKRLPRKDDLPIFFYNSRYPNEKFIDPGDSNRDAPRSFKFARGQFIAREQWQVNILRKKPHVYEADFDEDLTPCDICGYTTRSLRDYSVHMQKHI
jgi:hypothetical protein